MTRHQRLSAQGWLRLKYAVHEADQWRCVRCGAIRGLDAHHIIARSAGGDDTLANLVSLDRVCHEQVQPRWRQYVEELQAAVQRREGAA